MAATTSGRRRRSIQSGAGSALLASPRFGRQLFGVMAAVAVVYAGVALYGIVHGARTFGSTFMGMSRDQVRYYYGAPDAGSSDAMWRTRDGDAATSFLFDAHDRLVAVGCAPAGTGVGGDCPSALGLRLGDGEQAVWDRLGTPTATGFVGDAMIMAYPELGIRLKLRRATIVAIEHRHVSGIVPFAVRAISLLAP